MDDFIFLGPEYAGDVGLSSGAGGPTTWVSVPSTGLQYSLHSIVPAGVSSVKITHDNLVSYLNLQQGSDLTIAPAPMATGSILPVVDWGTFAQKVGEQTMPIMQGMSAMATFPITIATALDSGVSGFVGGLGTWAGQAGADVGGFVGGLGTAASNIGNAVLAVPGNLTTAVNQVLAGPGDIAKGISNNALLLVAGAVAVAALAFRRK